jgi:hypothetical protein
MKTKSTKEKSPKAVKITQVEQIKTFEDACRIEDLDPKKVLPDFSDYPQQDQAAMIAHAQLVIIVRAANRVANKGKEWKPDWNNYSQDKWYPWFEMGGSAGFRFIGYDRWDSSSGVGSRLCFISQEVGTYVATQFIDLYKQYFIL